jgi:hypothetical protein
MLDEKDKVRLDFFSGIKKEISSLFPVYKRYIAYGMHEASLIVFDIVISNVRLLLSFYFLLSTGQMLLEYSQEMRTFKHNALLM